MPALAWRLPAVERNKQVPPNETDWEEIEAGRLARLRLRGPSGSLDLWAAYLTTGEDPKADHAARAKSRQLLHNNLAPSSTASDSGLSNVLEAAEIAAARWD